MRIISGTHGGRRIRPPGNMPHTRPTTDLAKEGLFNILQHTLDFSGLTTLDLFGGTGSISYELASRGATQLTIVEKDPAMFRFIKKTCADLKFEQITVVHSDVFSFIKNTSQQFDFIFAGPPYSLDTIDELPKQIAQKKLLLPNGIFVLEHTPRNNYELFPHFVKSKNYGTTVFSFFNAANE